MIELDLGRIEKEFLRTMSVFNSYQTTNFGMVQIGSICRRKYKCNLTIKISYRMGRKYCGKRRKCWLSAFSPFPTMISKGFFPRVFNSQDCVVNGSLPTLPNNKILDGSKLKSILMGECNTILSAYTKYRHLG